MIINEVIELLPSLSREQQQQLECDISFEELTAASKLLEDGKAPGLDKVPAEFYKAFWNIRGPALMETLLESRHQGELPLSCRRAVLSPPKERGFAADYELAACVIAQHRL